MFIFIVPLCIYSSTHLFCVQVLFVFSFPFLYNAQFACISFVQLLWFTPPGTSDQPSLIHKISHFPTRGPYCFFNNIKSAKKRAPCVRAFLALFNTLHTLAHVRRCGMPSSRQRTAFSRSPRKDCFVHARRTQSSVRSSFLRKDSLQA